MKREDLLKVSDLSRGSWLCWQEGTEMCLAAGHLELKGLVVRPSQQAVEPQLQRTQYQDLTSSAGISGTKKSLTGLVE